jgi:uncharacterized protein
MSSQHAVEAIDKVAASGFVNGSLTVVWHAGEPLVLPITYYEEIFSTLALRPYGALIKHSIQTNGMMINDSWCDLFCKWNVSVGVSLDGPAFIHDAHRKDRAGKGTHARVMAGVDCLRRNDITFHVIAVITAESLPYPKEIFDFLLENGVRQVGFNIEELEGCHDSTTLSEVSAISRLEEFFNQLSISQSQCGNRMRVREFDYALRTILCKERRWDGSEIPLNDQSVPISIVSIDYQGGISTFSPELLGLKSKEFGNFVFGNIFTDNLEDILKNKKFLAIFREIESGVQRCADSCEYFPLCGGGAPSNKYYENGTFNSAETLYCRSVIQAPIKIMLKRLEEEISLPVPTDIHSRQSICNPPVT